MGNLKLGVKLVGGFLVCAAITLVVGVVGLTGLSSVSSHLSQVADVSLPSVRNLQHIKIAGETIRVAQRTMLVPGLLPKDRQRQFDNVANLRDSYRKAWDEYDKLPKSAEEELLWRELAPAWQEWVKGNNESFELAKAWDASGIRDPNAMHMLLEKFRADHAKLLADVLAFVTFGKEFPGGDNATTCKFGRWLESDARDIANPVFRKAIQEITPWHDKLHQSVARLKEASKRGASREELLQIVRTDIEPPIGHFMELPTAPVASRSEITEAVQPVPVVPGETPSATTEAQTPVKITADRMTYVEKDRKVTFSGNVQAEHEGLQLWATTLSAYFTEAGKGAKDVADNIERIVADGGVKMKKEKSEGTCQTLIYFVKDGVLRMEGNPRLNDGANSVAGEVIKFYVKDNRSEVLGGQNKRVEAIFRVPEGAKKP